jgi:hypothetical protein
MLLAQALGEYGLAAMMGALRTTFTNLELSFGQNPTPFYVVGALGLLVWFVFLKRN